MDTTHAIGNLEDLEAVAQLEGVLEAIPEGHRGRATVLNNLGVYWYTRYGRTRDLQDLDNAIVQLKLALEDDPATSNGERLCNLGNMLVSKYDSTADLQDLDDAIAALEAAVERTPENYSLIERAEYLNELANALHTRYDATRNLQDLDTAIMCMQGQH